MPARLAAARSLAVTMVATAAVCAGLVVAARAFTTEQVPAAQTRPTLPVNPNDVSPEAGTSTISGVVTDAATGQAIAGATVYLGPPSHGPPDTPVRQLTDSRGRFVFTRLPAFGGYFLQVTAGGYFTGYYGRGSSGALGARIAVHEGEWFGEADVALERPAVITGRVLDERGDPLVGVYVHALPRLFIAGQARIVAGQLATTDDRGVYRISGLNPGEYLLQVPVVQSTLPASVFDPPVINEMTRPFRDPSYDPSPGQAGLYRLALGQYPTPLPLADGRMMAYQQTWFPGASSPIDAAPIVLGSGEERAGVDVRLQPVPTYTISGRLDGPADVVGGVMIRALPPGTEQLGYSGETAMTVSNPDGTFALRNVPAGSYTLVAQNAIAYFELATRLRASTADLPEAVGPTFSGMGSRSVLSGPDGLRLNTRRTRGDQTWRGVASVSLDATDAADLVIAMDDGATISGRFRWETEAEAAEHGYPSSVRLEPANGDPTLGAPQSRLDVSNRMTNDTFEVGGLLGGRYILSATVLGGGRIKQVTWNGQDYTNRPFDASSGADITGVDVLLTAVRMPFSGTVRDQQGRTPEQAAVIVFPAEREQWTDYGFSPERIKALQTTNDGGFAFQSLPAGRYLAVAVEADLVNAWKTPDFLRRAAPLATPFELAWDGSATLDLVLVTIPR